MFNRHESTIVVEYVKWTVLWPLLNVTIWLYVDIQTIKTCEKFFDIPRHVGLIWLLNIDSALGPDSIALLYSYSLVYNFDITIVL